VPALNNLDLSIGELQFGPAQGGPINLSRAELSGARLDQATLIEANLVGAVLVDADLSDARLEKADLRGAKLAHATLSGARLDNADLCGADLSLAKGLTQEQIDRALGDRRTSLPAALAMPKAWLAEDAQDLGRLVTQDNQADAGEESADPYEILGVSPGATLQDIRIAWLNLVKDLHPDGSPGEASASERLKAVNRAYQRLKDLERRPTRTVSGVFHNARAVLATFVIVAVTIATLVVGIETYLARAGAAGGEETPPTRTSLTKSEQASAGMPSL
jgi:hypothetical protein